MKNNFETVNEIHPSEKAIRWLDVADGLDFIYTSLEITRHPFCIYDCIVAYKGQ
jgi:hypothetical protein